MENRGPAKVVHINAATNAKEDGIILSVSIQKNALPRERPVSNVMGVGTIVCIKYLPVFIWA